MNSITNDVYATFGTAFSPVNGKYVVSQLVMRLHNAYFNCGAAGVGSSASTATPNSYSGQCADARNFRQVKRFAAVDYSLLGFSNIQDAVTGTVYRVAQFNDSGRSTNIGVEWPSTVITISVT
jgi:hypothetical protein